MKILSINMQQFFLYLVSCYCYKMFVFCAILEQFGWSVANLKETINSKLFEATN